jgi:FixJ family two-component response regulator
LRKIEGAAVVKAKSLALSCAASAEGESGGVAACCTAAMVFVVEDQAAMRQSLHSLIESAGFQTEVFSSATEFLASPRALCPSCLVLDIMLPDLNGLDLQERLSSERREMPVIIMTGHGDVPMSVRAMKSGAIDFLTKPFSDDALVGAIRRALERSRALLREAAEKLVLAQRYSSLSCREREVMALVVSGRLNKEIAGELGISEITVKAHRGRAMHKMKARTLANLITMAFKLGLASENDRREHDRLLA